MQFRVQAHDRWQLYFIEGVILVLLGAAALILPPFTNGGISVLLGVIFLIGGAVGLITTIGWREAPGAAWALVSSIVTIAAGLWLVVWPMTNFVSLVLMLTAFLVADGVVTIIFGLAHREVSRRWGWIVTNGVVDLVLGGVIIWALPTSAFWALGVIIGIDLVYSGASMIALSAAMDRSRVVSAG